jgi:hypothetical protein
MAYVRTNERQSGDPSYTVMWRAGGSRTGKTQRETFDDEDVAKRFCDLVNGHAQQWPPGWVKGIGFVEPDEGPVPPGWGNVGPAAAAPHGWRGVVPPARCWGCWRAGGGLSVYFRSGGILLL